MKKVRNVVWLVVIISGIIMGSTLWGSQNRIKFVTYKKPMGMYLEYKIPVMIKGTLRYKGMDVENLAMVVNHCDVRETKQEIRKELRIARKTYKCN